jgi:hypothetical protein
MLLGQLYAYSNYLNSFPAEINQENVTSLQILGLDKTDLEEISQLSSEALKVELKDKFCLNFQQILLDNNLHLALKVWQVITSPLANLQFPKTSNSYLKLVKEWEEQDFARAMLPDVLLDGLLSTDENSYAVYYGLSVIHKLASENHIKIDILLADELVHQEKLQEISSTTLAAICPSIYSPLFVNLGCIFIPELNQEKLIKAVTEKLAEHPQISLILLVGQTENTWKVLTKEFPNLDIINLEWNIWEEKEKGFFDELAMQSLGIRL